MRRLDAPGSTGAVRLVTEHGRVDATRAVLATNVFPSLLKRNRLMTVPVYDYVLMTEPLSAEQRARDRLDEPAGRRRPGQPVPLLRLTRDNRILFGGYDAVYHFGGRVREQYEHRPEPLRPARQPLLHDLPQLEGLRSPTSGRARSTRRTQFTAFYGLARDGRVAYAAGFTGLGVASTRFTAEVMLDLLAGRETERTRLEMVRERPLPFPPEPAPPSASTRRAGRSTAPTTTAAGATCC